MKSLTIPVPAGASHVEIFGSGGSYAKLSVLDTFTGNPDPGLIADAALEARIDAAHDRMVRAPTEEESKEHWSECYRLILQRSTTQIMKLELERRMRART